MKTKRWNPENGKKFWYYNTSFTPISATWTSKHDIDWFWMRAVFKTKKEAVAMRDKIEALVERELEKGIL